MDRDQTTSVEQEMAAMQAHQAETDKQINQLLTAIAHLTQLTQPPESVITPKPHPVPPPVRARPVTPPEFNGD